MLFLLLSHATQPVTALRPTMMLKSATVPRLALVEVPMQSPVPRLVPGAKAGDGASADNGVGNSTDSGNVAKTSNGMLWLETRQDLCRYQGQIQCQGW